MALIGVTASREKSAQRYLASLESRGAQTKLLLPHEVRSVEEVVAEIDALLMTGGPDIHPSFYGELPDPSAPLETLKQRDLMELPLLKAALDRDLPVLAICRGMQALNVVMGGKLIQHLEGHEACGDGSAFHRVFVTPGSQLASILGTGGFFKVNSRHHQGIREPQKAPHLLASAYSLEDGLIEALESPRHSWVIGVQWHPEREDEIAPNLRVLFDAFIDRAERRNRS